MNETRDGNFFIPISVSPQHFISSEVFMYIVSGRYMKQMTDYWTMMQHFQGYNIIVRIHCFIEKKTTQ